MSEVVSRPFIRTLAARKAYDEPLDISIERKAKETRYVSNNLFNYFQ